MKMRLKLMMLLLTASIGCTNPKVPTTSNLTDGLNHSIAHNRKCLAFDDSTFLASPQPDSDGLDSLVGLGMLSKSAAAPDATGRPRFLYTLTGKGKATRTELTALNGQQRVGYLCSGRLVVDKVANFTEPAENHGVRETQVTYITKLVEVPAWAKDPVIQKLYPYLEPIPTRVGIGAKERATMTLTNEGWRVNGDM